MRKIRLVLAAAASAAVIGGAVPAVATATTQTSGAASAERTSAASSERVQAADCKDKLAKGRNGKVYVYATYNCKGAPICVDVDNDKNYRSGGDCQGANDRASSILNRGYSSAPSAVRFYEHSGYNGGSTCLKAGKYKSKLPSTQNNKISSHKWVTC
jgi:hypothetical protein